MVQLVLTRFCSGILNVCRLDAGQTVVLDGGRLARRGPNTCPGASGTSATRCPKSRNEIRRMASIAEYLNRIANPVQATHPELPVLCAAVERRTGPLRLQPQVYLLQFLQVAGMDYNGGREEITVSCLIP